MKPRLIRFGSAVLVCAALGVTVRAGEDPRKATFKRLEALIAAEEKKAEAGENVRERALEQALGQLQELQWKLDGIAAVAFVQSARAQVLLERYEEAVKTLKMGADHLAKIEAILEDKGKKAASPVAGALLYYGKALRGQAVAAFRSGDRKTAKRHLLEAAKRFRKVVRTYPESSYRAQAEAEFNRCSETLAARFGVDLKTK